MIADYAFKELYRDDVESLTKGGNPLYSDYQAVVSSLNYIKNNRGSNSIPLEPVVFIFTNTENNYHISIKEKNANQPEVKRFKAEIHDLVSDLRRTNSDNNVKFIYIPKNYINLMPDLETYLKENKSLNLKARIWIKML